MITDEQRAKNRAYWHEYYEDPVHRQQRSERKHVAYLRDKTERVYLSQHGEGSRQRPPGDFWSHVDKTGECWLWLGAKAITTGYGKLGRTVNGKKVTIPAHRYSWTLTNGPIPGGLCVLHRCDNPPCVRPDHLFLGTHLDNSADALAGDRVHSPRTRHANAAVSAKMRGVSRGVGEANANAKLTRGQVDEIRHRYTSGLGTQRQIGLDYGVTNEAVSAIIRGKAWAR